MTMAPLVVRADLAQGVAHAAPWMPALDGILAAEVSDSARDEAIAVGETPHPRIDARVSPLDLDLPLARCELAGGDDWHWASTCATPVGAAVPVVRYWTGRADHLALGELVEKLPAHVSDRQGPLRARHMPLLVTHTAAVQWWCVGNRDAVHELVSGIGSIGKKRSHGEGRVLRWHVEKVSVDEWTAGHLYPDGRLGRVCTSACVVGHEQVASGGAGWAGLRPPAFHPAMRRSALLPAPAVATGASVDR